MMKKILLFSIVLGLILCGCKDKTSVTKETEVEKNAVQNIQKDSLSSQKSVAIDSSKCIELTDLKTGYRSPCSYTLVCPDDSGAYKAFRLMEYVDGNLSADEKPALQWTCGVRADTLTNGSLEMYVFTHWYGASYEDMFIYYRRKNQKFRRLKKFNPDHQARGVEVLETQSHGVHDFKTKEVYTWVEYTLSFNGRDFDTTYIYDIPWKEFKKAGIKSYISSIEPPPYKDSIITRQSRNSYHIFKFICSTSDRLTPYYHLDTEGLFGLIAGFVKTEDTDYKFIGYFPNWPQNKVLDIYNGYPVLQTLSRDEVTEQEELRLHYYDGKKYVGVLSPLTMSQRLNIQNGKTKMHPRFHLEVYPENDQ